MLRSGVNPASRIIWRARSTILTGWPISRTKILPRESPSSASGVAAEASSTSSTASRTVMKNRLASGCVTVSGPPAASWRAKSGTTEPLDPSTLPNRTVTNRVPSPSGEARKLAPRDRRVGRDHHHELGAVSARRLGDVAAADDIGQDALDWVGLDHRHLFEGRGMKHDLQLLAGDDRIDPAALADIGEQRMDCELGPALAQFTVDRVKQEFAVVDQDQPRR